MYFINFKEKDLLGSIVNVKISISEADKNQGNLLENVL